MEPPNAQEVETSKQIYESKVVKKDYQASTSLLFPPPYRLRKAGLTSTPNLALTSIPEKYFRAIPLFTPISALNSPMGSLPKSISTLQLYDVVGMYCALIEVLALSPDTMVTARMSSHWFLQSLESISYLGR